MCNALSDRWCVRRWYPVGSADCGTSPGVCGMSGARSVVVTVAFPLSHHLEAAAVSMIFKISRKSDLNLVSTKNL
jgi:hypothetical protein